MEHIQNVPLPYYQDLVNQDFQYQEHLNPVRLNL